MMEMTEESIFGVELFGSDTEGLLGITGIFVGEFGWPCVVVEKNCQAREERGKKLSLA